MKNSNQEKKTSKEQLKKMVDTDKFKWKVGELSKGVNHGVRFLDGKQQHRADY